MSLSVSANTLITQIMKSDADKSGTISKAEFQNWAAGKSGSSTGTTKAMFGQIDANKSGDLSQTELQSFFSPKLDLAAFLQSQSANNAGGPSILDSLSTNSGSSSSPSIFDSLSGGSSASSTDSTMVTLNKMLQAYAQKKLEEAGGNLSASA